MYGKDECYINGAIENSILARNIFHDWITRYYVDNTVPNEVIRRLEEIGSEIVFKQQSIKFSGSLWRFEVAFDPNVQFYIVRDTDDRLCLRQYTAVKEWINSGKTFHIMRDHPNHKHEIMAGMWGGVSKSISEFERLYNSYFLSNKYEFWSDTKFLKCFIWDKYVKLDHCAHDEYWRPLGTEKKFTMPLEHPGKFVGNKYDSRGDPVYDLIKDDEDNSSVFLFYKNGFEINLTQDKLCKYIDSIGFKNVYLFSKEKYIDTIMYMCKDIPSVHVIKVFSKSDIQSITSKYPSCKSIYVDI